MNAVRSVKCWDHMDILQIVSIFYEKQELKSSTENVEGGSYIKV